MADRWMDDRDRRMRDRDWRRSEQYGRGEYGRNDYGRDDDDRGRSPEGRSFGLYPFLRSCCMDSLYGLRIFLLSAFGFGVLESHHTYSTESRTRCLRTFTHSAGLGSFAGLYQKHS